MGWAQWAGRRRKPPSIGINVMAMPSDRADGSAKTPPWKLRGNSCFRSGGSPDVRVLQYRLIWRLRELRSGRYNRVDGELVVNRTRYSGCTGMRQSRRRIEFGWWLRATPNGSRRTG